MASKFGGVAVGEQVVESGSKFGGVAVSDAAPKEQQAIKEPSFTETLQILRGDDILGNAQKLGFNIVPEFDPISGEEIDTRTLTFDRGGEKFQLDLDSISTQLTGAIRPTAQATGGIVGGALGLASPMPGGAALGSITGGTAGGQVVDLVTDFISGQGLGTQDALQQAKDDLIQETVFGLGGEVAGRALAPVIKGTGRALKGAKDIIKGGPDDVIPRVEPTISLDAVDSVAAAGQRDVSEVAESVSRADIPAAVADVRPRPEVVAAARAEGFELTPDQLSGNPAFIELAQAAKSSPGSTLAVDEINSIKKLGRSLDDLKLRVGGDVDKALVNENVAAEFNKIIGAIQAKESPLYDKVADAINVDSRHTPETLINAVNSQARIVGGHKNLGGVWSKINAKLLGNMEDVARGQGILGLTETTKTPQVTYGFIDKLRKDVGAGYKGQGGFKDAATGDLDQAYKALSEEQQRIAGTYGEGVAADMALARKLSAERIGIQKNTVKFGKDLVDIDGNITDGPFVHKLESAMKSLSNGNTKQFDSLMMALPDSQKAAVAISALDPLLSSSVMKSGNVTGAMANAGRALNRNKTAKAKLYKYLPVEEAKRLDNLFSIADGIFSSVERQNASRTARDVLKAMDDELSPLRKLYNVGKGAARVAAPGTSTVVDLGANTVKNVAKERSSTAQAADNLLSSKKFNTALNDFINEESGQFKAQSQVMNMPETQNWLKTLPQNQREEVGRIGLFNYLFRIGEGAQESLTGETE